MKFIAVCARLSVPSLLNDSLMEHTAPNIECVRQRHNVRTTQGFRKTLKSEQHWNLQETQALVKIFSILSKYEGLKPALTSKLPPNAVSNSRQMTFELDVDYHITLFKSPYLNYMLTTSRRELPCIEGTVVREDGVSSTA